MLRNMLLISTASGVVVFSKEFVDPVKQRENMLGSLLIAMLQYSSQQAGLRLSHVELQNITVTIVTDDSVKLACALFHDVEDGIEFGKIIATEIIRSFVRLYCTQAGSDLSWSANLKTFQNFHTRLPEVFQGSVKPVLAHLNECRGIKNVVLVRNGHVIYSGGAVDEVGLVANLNVLETLSTELLSMHQDRVIRINSDGSRTRTIIVAADAATLVVICRRSVAESVYKPSIDKAVTLIRRVYNLLSNLQAVR